MRQFIRKPALVFVFLFFVFSWGYSQKKSSYVKANALFVAVGMVNLGIEHQISKRYTLQGDFFISPWKEFLGYHAQVYMMHIEGRYYFEEAFSRWYIGVNIGGGIFDITKWSHVQSDKYQRGFNYMLGGTLGYHWNIHPNWNIDIYVGGGNSQGYYHGYEKTKSNTIERYDGAKNWNKSGEWLPYRGGLMVSYKIK